MQLSYNEMRQDPAKGILECTDMITSDPNFYRIAYTYASRSEDTLLRNHFIKYIAPQKSTNGELFGLLKTPDDVLTYLNACKLQSINLSKDKINHLFTIIDLSPQTTPQNILSFTNYIINTDYTILIRCLHKLPAEETIQLLNDYKKNCTHQHPNFIIEVINHATNHLADDHVLDTLWSLYPNIDYLEKMISQTSSFKFLEYLTQQPLTKEMRSLVNHRLNCLKLAI